MAAVRRTRGGHFSCAPWEGATKWNGSRKLSCAGGRHATPPISDGKRRIGRADECSGLLTRRAQSVPQVQILHPPPEGVLAQRQSNRLRSTGRGFESRRHLPRMGGRAVKAPVPKTGCAQALGGANPSPSAIQAISSTAEHWSPKPATRVRHLHRLPCRDLAELADAPASETDGASRAGSTPAVPTICSAYLSW